MAFLQQQQQQSDGFQNLLGILKANRERDAADLANFHDGNLAVSKKARARLISNGVIDENDTLDGIQSGIEKQVKDAEGAKAGENTSLNKSVGNGYMASKLGQQGHAEQQAFADAGSGAFNKTALDAGVRFGGEKDPRGLENGVAYKWNGTQYSRITDDEADKLIRAKDIHTEENKDKGLGALRYAAQQKADERTQGALETPVSSMAELRAAKLKDKNLGDDLAASETAAKENADAFAKEGESAQIPTVNKAKMQQRDDADAVSEAKGKIVAKAGDVNKIFDAANNESGNAQYNYARGKQYIEDTLPAGPARDAAVNRYSEMFMQQQLVGKEGAYMGNVYDKNKGHADGTGRSSKEKIAQIGDGVFQGGAKFNYTGYATPEAMNAGVNGDRKDFLREWAIAFHGGHQEAINPKVVKYSNPAMWDENERNLLHAMDTKPLQSGLNDMDKIDTKKYEELLARKVPEPEAYAAALIKPKKPVSDADKAALGKEKGFFSSLLD